MKDTIVLIKNELGGFLEKLALIIGNPATPVLREESNSERLDLSKSLMFFLLCILSTKVFSIPVFGYDSTLEKKRLLLGLCGDVIYLLLTALVLHFAFKIMGSKAPFKRNFFIWMHHLGVALLAYWFLEIIILGIVYGISSDLYDKVVTFNFNQSQSEYNPFDYFLEDYGSTVFVILSLVAYILVFFGLYKSWSLYRQINPVKGWRNRIAATIFIIGLIFTGDLLLSIDKMIVNTF